MNVENWLNQVRDLDQQIFEKLEEKEQLLALATDISPKPMDGMPFSNTGTVSQKMPDAVIKLIELAQEIDKLVDEYVAKKQEIENLLAKLPEKEYKVMHRYYIHKKKVEEGKFKCMTWEQVAEDLGYSTVQVWRIKKKSLKILQNVIVCNAKKV